MKTCYMCKNEYSTDGNTCVPCTRLPTVRFQVIGNDKYGCPFTVTSGETIREGKSQSDAWYRDLTGGTKYDTIRKWAADAAARGATDLRVEFRRHTRELGWSDHSARVRPYRVVRLKVEPCAFGDVNGR